MFSYGDHSWCSHDVLMMTCKCSPNENIDNVLVFKVLKCEVNVTKWWNQVLEIQNGLLFWFNFLRFLYNLLEILVAVDIFHSCDEHQEQLLVGRFSFIFLIIKFYKLKNRLLSSKYLLWWIRRKSLFGHTETPVPFWTIGSHSRSDFSVTLFL